MLLLMDTYITYMDLGVYQARCVDAISKARWSVHLSKGVCSAQRLYEDGKRVSCFNTISSGSRPNTYCARENNLNLLRNVSLISPNHIRDQILQANISCNIDPALTRIKCIISSPTIQLRWRQLSCSLGLSRRVRRIRCERQVTTFRPPFYRTGI